MMVHPQVKLQMVEIQRVMAHPGVQPSRVPPGNNVVVFYLIRPSILNVSSRYDVPSPGRTSEGVRPGDNLAVFYCILSLIFLPDMMGHPQVELQMVEL